MEFPMPRLFSLVLLLPLFLFARDPGDKPNVIFIMLDDLGREWVECYGGEKGLTPNVDKLAATGMRFENAYSMPQCTPSRATLLTGQYPWRHGWVNHWDVPRWGAGCHFDPKKNHTFAKVMKTAGYKTAAAGKWQINDFRVQPQIMREHGFDAWCMWTGFESGVKASAERYWDPCINTPEGSKTYKGRFGADVFTDFLVDFLKKNKDDPMMIYFPMALPHGPMVHTPKRPDAKTTLEKHRAMVEYADLMLGRLVTTLEELKIRDNTIIIWTTDNGSGGGIKGTYLGETCRGGKATDTERGTNAPFVVSCPGLVPEGVVTDALTDFSDLLPTFAELGGATIDLSKVNTGVIDGKSIAPLLLGKAPDSPRSWIMAQGHGPAKLDPEGVRGKADYGVRTIRNKQFKILVSAEKPLTNDDNKPAALYHVAKDWYTKNNVIDNPEYAAELQKLVDVAKTFPEKDARPAYDPTPAQPWDKKLGGGKKKKDKKKK
jgi:arylsulfatase A-like enzyme